MTVEEAPTSGSSEPEFGRPGSGRVVLVVGGTAGIGAAVCAHAVRIGARVVVSGRQERPAGYGAATYVPCDVRREADCTAMVDVVVRQWGRLDAVVYAAGVSPLAPLESADSTVWHDVLDTIVVGAAQTLRVSLPHLLAVDGRFVVLGSTMVGRPWPGMVPYAAARAGLQELVRGARLEQPRLRLTQVVVGPTRSGFEAGFDTPALNKALDLWRRDGFLRPDRFSLTPDEVAEAVVSTLIGDARIDDLSVAPYRFTADADRTSEPSPPNL